jgi:hypothetical protein
MAHELGALRKLFRGMTECEPAALQAHVDAGGLAQRFGKVGPQRG